MSLFDSILPSSDGDTPANMQGLQTPANIMALIQGLPATQRMAQQMSPLPSPAPAPASMAAPSSDPIAALSTALRPRVAPSATTADNLPDPTTTGFQAAGQAAGNTQAESNPLNTLLISLANGASAGNSAFRAQKRQNQEDANTAAITAHDNQAHRDYINSPEAAKVFGDQVGAARSMSDAELGPWLVKNSIVPPNEYSQNQEGQVTWVKGQGAKGQVVQGATLRPVNPGQAVPRMQQTNGVITQARDPITGAPVYDNPNPLPTPKPAALTAAQQRENDARNLAGIGPSDPIDDSNRDAYQRGLATVAGFTHPSRTGAAPRLARVVQTGNGFYSVDPVTHKMTQLTDANGYAPQPPKSAAMVKAQSDSALVAKVTGSTGTKPPPDQITSRTATAKAILNGSQPGDKSVAQAWLKLHP